MGKRSRERMTGKTFEERKYRKDDIEFERMLARLAIANVRYAIKQIGETQF